MVCMAQRDIRLVDRSKMVRMAQPQLATGRLNAGLAQERGSQGAASRGMGACSGVCAAMMRHGQW
jgi:hypothetical protein